MTSLLLHLHLLPPPSHHLFTHKLQTPSLKNISFHIPKPRKLFISASSSNNPSSSSSSSSSWEREETRWLREEQRWMREEQRWLREESRWNTERNSLLQQINSLKNQLLALEQRQGGSQSEKISNISNLLQISETGSGPVPIMLESLEEEEEVKEMVVKEVRVLESAKEEMKKVDVKKNKKVAMIRKGAEGEEVRAMQEALLKLGFYSGEEDMEFSSFSSDTERAIKTWQASLGAPEDGIMTAELLEKLFMDQETVDGNTISPIEKESANGASVASATEVYETKQVVVKESGDAEVDSYHHRVFLLGENRWEDSSRLTSRDKQIGRSTIGISTTKCMACHGEGHILCTECDGTGEPNVEEQFLEWVDEGAKCPYCEGLGYNICDVCEGKTIISA